MWIVLLYWAAFGWCTINLAGNIYGVITKPQAADRFAQFVGGLFHLATFGTLILLAPK